MPTNSVILSFLGLGKRDPDSKNYLGYYQETPYGFQRQTLTTNYFAQALCSFFPQRELYIVMTEDVEEVQAASSKPLSNLCSYTPIEIPVGEDEDELWVMFGKIAEGIPEGANLIVDITHGFRSQPMLALAACMYLRAVKGVVIERIVYGAYEVKDKPKHKGIAPVFDVTQFLELIDWSFSTQLFHDHGDAAPLRNLLNQRTAGDKDGQNFDELANELQNLTQSLAMIRPLEALSDSTKLRESIDGVTSRMRHNPSTQPLASLLGRFETRLGPLEQAKNDAFDEEGFQAQAAMLEFYLSTEQYAQAITLAREAVTSKICVDNQYDPRNTNHRQNKANRNIGKLPDLAQIAEEAKVLRDDLNHAGMRPNPIPTQEAIKRIRKVCRDVMKKITTPDGTYKFP